ncbi:hypothetical protein TrVE_jg3717 [Triparma verrucosa]|uniref:Uncharacterized protein n=1 Tax=Triparma verrucosa TaxID=1606542 RepID=A0A9W7EXN1_9STRA|nr:hypothetical protein TrVE_jg3717 [Triparma verrucosa]
MANRRQWIAGGFTAAASVIYPDETTAASVPPPASSPLSLKWQDSPYNLRTHTTLYDAESTYPLPFITYLTRLLLTYDPLCRNWYVERARSIPLGADEEEVYQSRLEDFGRFSGSVDLGLRDYLGSQGTERLFVSLIERFASGKYGDEARRQICLLFSLIKSSQQPTLQITQNLALLENATLETVTLLSPGTGYAPGYGPPLVTVSPPDSPLGSPAYVKSNLSKSGRILRIDVSSPGSGYASKPSIYVSAPKNGTKATAQAYVKDGGLQRVEVVFGGEGYGEEEVKVRVSLPENAGGTPATCVAVPELEVSSLEIINPGWGYSSNRTLELKIDPPPITSRVNLNALPTKKTQSLINKLGSNSTSGCVGRGCYDALPTGRGTTGGGRGEIRGNKIKGTVPDMVGSGSGVSSKLLGLFGDGVGVTWDGKRWGVKAGAEAFLPTMPNTSSNSRPVDPSFGPRGRSPIEREKNLSTNTYLRFMVSGALCCSVVHLGVTPLDVVKTKLQTDPVNYPGPIIAFKKVVNEEGLSTFFSGWAPTFVGFFCWGAVGYTLTEFLKRQIFEITQLPASYEIPVIVLASGIGAFVGAFVIAPFETVRIRMVSDSSFPSSFPKALARIVDGEGVGALFNAVPAFWLKEIPFAVAKFGVFDFTTNYIYDLYPVAREDLKLSLAVSLFGGCVGGIAAAIISNPADCTISEMKKKRPAVAEVNFETGELLTAAECAEQECVLEQEKVGPVQAATVLYERNGINAFFTGWSVRIVFYSLVVSLQFLLYDSIRVALGVGRDDLRMFLDVLGGALNDTPFS